VSRLTMASAAFGIRGWRASGHSAAPIACGTQTVSIAITKVTVSVSRPVNRLLPLRKIGTPDMSITPLPYQEVHGMRCAVDSVEYIPAHSPEIVLEDCIGGPQAQCGDRECRIGSRYGREGATTHQI